MKVRRRVYASGKIGWQADLGVVNGRRVQVACGSEGEARRRIEDERRRRARYGELGAGLSAAEMAEVTLAREIGVQSDAKVACLRVNAANISD